MIVSPRRGPAGPEPHGAKILVFKPRPLGSRPSPEVQVESGSGWYHEAAIKEAEAQQGRKQ